MARAALTHADIQEFRTRTVEVAMRLFAEHGAAGVTMRSVAQAMGCSPMTPYRYFASKDALLNAVRAQAFAHFGDDQNAVFVRVNDPLECLLALKKAYIDYALAHPHAYRVMFDIGQPKESADAELVKQSSRAFGGLLTATRNAVAAGYVEGDPLTLAHLFWASAHGLVMLHLSGTLGMGRSIHHLSGITLELPTPRRRT